MVFGVVTPYRLAYGYQRFGETSSLHIHGICGVRRSITNENKNTMDSVNDSPQEAMNIQYCCEHPSSRFAGTRVSECGVISKGLFRYVAHMLRHSYRTQTLKMNSVCSSETSFGGLEVACWPLVPKFAGSNPAEKILSTPPFRLYHVVIYGM